MHQVNIDEATTQLLQLIDAALHGEVVLITTADARTVRLMPFTATRKPRHPGTAKGLIHMRDDFAAPLDEFAEYTA